MYNRVCVEGILTSTPTLGKTSKGKSSTTFVVACYKDGYGRGADYIKCKAYGRVAEALCTAKQQGDHLLIEGALVYNIYEDYMGKDVRELLISVKLIKFLAKEPRAKYADEFMDKYPEIKKLYNKFVKENGFYVKPEENENEEENEEC